MSSAQELETLLTGGHPNSLGNTVQVVTMVLADKKLFDSLYQCYFSQDEVVRLRVSNAMKRVYKEHPEWLVPYIDKFITEIALIQQASTQWTLAQLFLWLEKDMTSEQKVQATKIMQHNLETNNDWIVQNTCIETLGVWAEKDETLKKWLVPKLEEFVVTGRKSVAGRAKKKLAILLPK